MEDTDSTIFDYSTFHLFSVEIAFTEFRNYQNYFEAFLLKEKESFKKMYQEKLNYYRLQNDLETYNVVLENYSEKYSEITKLFPSSFRASFLIQIIAFIENELKEVCEHYESVKKTKYSIHDLRGSSDIEKAKQYLTKSCNVNFRNLNPEWEFILIAKKIRNKIIHNAGFIYSKDSDWKSIKEFNKQKEYIHFTPEGNDEFQKIILKSRLLTDELLDKSESFFGKLFSNELRYLDS